MRTFNKPYVRDGGRVFTPVYLPNETYSLYFNADIPLSCSASSIKLKIKDAAGTSAIIPVQIFYYLPLIDDVTVNYYHVAFTFVCPLLKDGVYYFVIEHDSVERAISNPILIWSEDTKALTSFVKFRHSQAIYGIDYNNSGFGEEKFYQSFRLPIHQVGIDFESERSNYRNSTDGRKLRNSTSYLDSVVKFESYWFDDESQEAMAILLEHDEVYIEDLRVVNKSQLSVEEMSEKSNRTKGSFTCYLDEFNRDLSLLENRGEVILYGGNALYLPHTILNLNF